MTEPMVPLSELEKILDDARYAEDIEEDLSELVKDLKNKPYEKMIPVSVIEERIKQLKENLNTAEGAETFDIDSRIDELEELLY